MAVTSLQMRLAVETIAASHPSEVSALVNRLASRLDQREWAHFCSLLEAASAEAKLHAPVYGVESVESP